MTSVDSTPTWAGDVFRRAEEQYEVASRMRIASTPGHGLYALLCPAAGGAHSQGLRWVG